MCKHREKWPCLRAAAPNPLPALSREELSRKEVCVCVKSLVQNGCSESEHTSSCYNCLTCVFMSLCIHASVVDSLCLLGNDGHYSVLSVWIVLTLPLACFPGWTARSLMLCDVSASVTKDTQKKKVEWMKQQFSITVTYLVGYRMIRFEDLRDWRMWSVI